MSDGTDGKSRKNATWPQWIAGFGALLLVTQIGLLTAWSSPYNEQLIAPDSPFPVTVSELSWVVSLLNLGRIFGAVGGATCTYYLGSKTTIQITNVPITLSWVFIVLASSVEWLYASRFLGGVGIGMTYNCYAIYLGEISSPNIRGALVSLASAGMPFGNLIMSIMGAYLRTETSALVALASCLALMLLFLWVPESPHHLIKKNSHEKARTSIHWYHRDCDVEPEFIRLRQFVEKFSEQSVSFKDLKTVQFRKSLAVVVILVMYNQSCGVNSVLFYMESILTSAKVTMVEPSLMVIIVMTFGVIGAGASMFLIDRCGRKMLMIVSCTGISLSLTLLTIEFQLLSFGFEAETVQLLSVIGMCLLYLAMFIGALPVPVTILCEIFPPHLKCIAAPITSSVAGLVSFISTGTYVPLLDLMTERYLFLFYGALLATAVPFTMFCVPETKGLSLQEIQARLTRKKKPQTTEPAYDTERKASRAQNTNLYVIPRANLITV
ncbi:unnamed protein product [Xylocopa violacea]|uniref:Major facilitator superfamily (MFS) profile domain-containing protein n=1 Tax=Xylocopa violacea TaxID=135666 RepID=A0ABP1PL60_XYLVO